MTASTRALVAEDRAQLGDPLGDIGVLLFDAVGLQRGELREAQIEDRGGLDRAQLEARDQLLAGGCRGRASRGSVR